MSSILYVMCGLPYSGKSTYAQKLAAERGWALVSIDEIRERRGFVWGEREATAEDWREIFAEMEAAIVTALRDGRSVIYDSANQDKASRQRMRALAESVGCASRVVLVDTPLEVIMERRRANLERPTRSHIPQKFFEAALETFETPGDDEAVMKAEF